MVGLDWGQSDSLPALRCCNGVLFQGGHGGPVCSGPV